MRTVSLTSIMLSSISSTTSLNETFHDRFLKLSELTKRLEPTGRVKLLRQDIVTNATELEEFYLDALSKGFEGAMYRKINSPYKCGRSTLREGYLLKIKPFDPDEAEIIGFNQGETNLNEALKDAFGQTKRSSAASGKVLTDKLGSFHVRDMKTRVEFDCGTGLDDDQRKEIWANQRSYLGKIIRYKHQSVSADNVPRFPVFLSFRDKRDMDFE